MNIPTQPRIVPIARRDRSTIVASKSPTLSRLLLAAISSLGVSSAFADASWVGDTSQDWNAAANWSSDPAAPSGNLTVNTSLAGVYPVVSSTSTVTPVDLFVGNGAGQSGRLDQSTGTLALANSSTNGNWMFVGVNGGTGAYNLTGDGSLAVGKLWVGGFVYGENGVGTATINTTGSVNANSTDDFSGWGQYQTSVSVGWGPTGNGTLNLQNGTLNANGLGMYVGAWGSTGTVNQTGGTINTPSLSIAKWFGTGTMNVANGAVNVGGTVRLAVSGNGGDLMHGALNVNAGGVVNSEGDLVVAVGGNSASTGVLNIATGGIVNVGTTTERWMTVNQYDTVAGTVNIDGGTLNLNANSDLRFSTNGGTGPGVVNLNSGAITSHAGNQTGSSTTGVVDLNQAGGAAANNTFNLNGGTLTVAQIITNSNDGTATFNFNGGTLKAANGGANFLDFGGAGQSAVVKSGGAIIHSNGFNVTIPQALLNGGGGGGLIKNGTGTLTLSGANTYTGPTVINAGTLALGVGGALASTSYSIANGAAFDSSALPSFDLSTASMTIALDQATAGFFNAGAITLGNDLVLNFSTASLVDGMTYNLIDSTSQTGDFASVSISGGFSASLTRSGEVWSGSSGAFIFSFDEPTGVLTVGAIPEPASIAALLGVVALGACVGRRRRA